MFIELSGVTHRYGDHLILDQVDFGVGPGDRIALVAPSGSGKTTLLAILGLLLRPTEGEVRLSGTRASHSRRARTRQVQQIISWVFQTVSLVPHRTVLDNVALAGLSQGWNRATSNERAMDALARVGLDDHADRIAKTLSGGEAQRVGIARGIAGDASVLLADEPTANLDHHNRDTIADVLFELPDEMGLIVATHDLYLAERANRQVTIESGQLKDLER